MHTEDIWSQVNSGTGMAAVEGEGQLPQGPEAAEGRDVLLQGRLRRRIAGEAILGGLRSRYPKAHDVFKEELEDL